MPLTKAPNTLRRQINGMERITSNRIRPDQHVLCFHIAKAVDVTQRLEGAPRIVIDKERGEVEFVGDILWLIGEVQTQHMVVQMFRARQTWLNIVKPVILIFCQRLPLRPFHIQSAAAATFCTFSAGAS